MRSIRNKVILTYLFLVAISLAVATFYLLRALEGQYLRTYQYVVSTQARLISLMLGEYAREGMDPGKMEEVATNFKWRPEAEIAIYDARGWRPGSGSQETPREVAAALAGQEEQAVRYDPRWEEERVYAAVPIRQGGRVVGAVQVSVPKVWVRRQILRLAPALATAVLLGLLASWFIGSRLSRAVTVPIERLALAAQRIGAGHYGERVEVSSRDEIGRLAELFNSMAAKLNETIQEISRERNRLAAIMTSMTDALIATDRQGRIILMNRAAEELFGLPWEAAQGQHVRAIPSMAALPAGTAVDALCRMLEEAGEGKAGGEEIALGERILETHCAPVKGDGEVIGAVAVFHDVTEVRRAERLRRELTANVSHELRTPLTSIKGFVETLLHGAMEDPTTCRKFLEIIEGETNRLVKLTEDLLDLSRLESKAVAMEFADVDLGELIHEAVEKFRPQAERLGLSLVTSLPGGPVLVRADRDRIEQVLTNLLDNAFKHTPPGGRVQVRVGETPDHVSITVSDTGVGIPPGDLPRIFERFYRADRSRTRGSGGSGLGLAIAKHIVEAHGGRITAQSRLNEGTEITFTLPKGPTPRGPHQNPAAGFGGEPGSVYGFWQGEKEGP
jgi:PAS domain S-box-containing protein